MTQTDETRRACAAGSIETVCLAADSPDNPSKPAALQVNSRAVLDARLELLREAIFENLGAAKLFIETVLLLIEGRDDTGARHSLRMGALHFKAAIQKRATDFLRKHVTTIRHNAQLSAARRPKSRPLAPDVP